MYADIKRRGVILRDGEVNPAVEAHRKNAHEQLYSLSVFTELNRSQTAGEATDIVALMAHAAEPVESEQLVQPEALASGAPAKPEKQAEQKSQSNGNDGDH
ncbi:MAG: hypothetical protein JO033_01615 [Acidobacteriaceae bacterium]|nr:hypothetical protein [Acidobacteriaceae bacterium]MBV9500453.1 hypothetical protein [Acidobacteriaceae bacterium]